MAGWDRLIQLLQNRGVLKPIKIATLRLNGPLSIQKLAQNIAKISGDKNGLIFTWKIIPSFMSGSLYVTV